MGSEMCIRDRPGQQQPVMQGGQQQVAASQQPAPDLAVALAGILDMLKHKEETAATERDEERYLRDKQLEHTRQMTQLLDRKLGTDSSAAEPGTAKGRVTLVPPPNPVALAQTGCALAPQYALTGDTSTLDLSSAKNNIKSGRNCGITQDAVSYTHLTLPTICSV